MALRGGLGGRKSSASVGAPRAPEPVRALRPVGPPAGPVEVVVEASCAAGQIVPWFLDGHRWLRFQGRSAHVEPEVGGRIRVELGEGVVVVGRFTEIGPDRVGFTWGRPGDPVMPPESSRILVLATPLATGGCEIMLRHEGLPDQGVADAHRSGWRYHLVRLAVAATGVTAETETVDLFLAATSEADNDARRGLLERACTLDAEVADDAGRVVGIGPLCDHFGRAALSVPTRRLVRTGAVQRVGAMIRCPYSVVDRRVSGTATVEEGEIVAALDRSNRVNALSLFD